MGASRIPERANAAAQKFAREVILAAVSQAFLISVAEMTSQSRLSTAVRARYAAIWLMREIGRPATLKQMARAVGAEDHTTVLHGLVRAREFMDRYEDFRTRLDAARQTVLASATGERQRPFVPVTGQQPKKAKRPPAAILAAPSTKRVKAPAPSVALPTREPIEVIEMRRSVAMADQQFARLLKAQRALG